MLRSSVAKYLQYVEHLNVFVIVEEAEVCFDLRTELTLPLVMSFSKLEFPIDSLIS